MFLFLTDQWAKLEKGVSTFLLNEKEEQRSRPMLIYVQNEAANFTFVRPLKRQNVCDHVGFASPRRGAFSKRRPQLPTKQVCALPKAWFEADQRGQFDTALATERFGALFVELCRFPRSLVQHLVALGAERVEVLVRDRLVAAGYDLHHRFGVNRSIMGERVVAQRVAILLGAIEQCIAKYSMSFVLDREFEFLSGNVDHAHALELFLAERY